MSKRLQRGQLVWAKSYSRPGFWLECVVVHQGAVSDLVTVEQCRMHYSHIRDIRTSKPAVKLVITAADEEAMRPGVTAMLPSSYG